MFIVDIETVYNHIHLEVESLEEILDVFDQPYIIEIRIEKQSIKELKRK